MKIQNWKSNLNMQRKKIFLMQLSLVQKKWKKKSCVIKNLVKGEQETIT